MLRAGNRKNSLFVPRTEVTNSIPTQGTISKWVQPNCKERKGDASL
jgi:hypothetical protein